MRNYRSKKRNVLAEINQVLKDFSNETFTPLDIDTLRIIFSKRYKKAQLDKLGVWEKINKNSPILKKLKFRLTVNEITSSYQLKGEPIYYYNLQESEYRKAVMVIYGITQYHKETLTYERIESILLILKAVHSIDLCYDTTTAPNIERLNANYKLERCFVKGNPTSTYYINDTNIPTLDKVCFYDKAFKNNLDEVMHRIEATFTIPDHKSLNLPLHEFNKIIDIALSTTTKETLCEH